MLQTISPMDLRQQTGNLLNMVSYQKSRFLIKRKNVPLGVIIPYDDYQFYTKNEPRLYQGEEIKEFERLDSLTPKQKKAAKEIFKILSNKLDV